MPPNVDWCEQELCSWITNPADTWSNLAYLAFGVLMILETRRGAGAHRGELRLFGPVSIVVGLFSGIYHASYTFFLQFFDFVGMFLFCFTVLTGHAVRLGWVRPERRLTFFLGGVAFFSALVPVMYQLALPFQGLVFLLILGVVSQEGWVRQRLGPAPSYRSFVLALGLLVAAAGFSLADVTRTWCDPTNHWLQGHALWHVLSAAALFALYRHHAQPLPAARP